MMTKRDEIKNQLKKQEQDFYGEESVGGHMQALDTDDNVKEAFELVVGEGVGRELNLEKEVEDDEKKIAGLPSDFVLNDELVPEENEELERVEETEMIDYLK